MVIFLVTHGVILYLSNNKKLIIQGIVVGLVLLMPMSFSIQNRMQSQGMGEANWSDLGRVSAFVAGLHMVAEHPYRGVGYRRSNQMEVYRAYADPRLPSMEGMATIHNAYLIVFAEQGIGGGVLFLLLNFYLLFSLWKILRKNAHLESRPEILFVFASVVSYMLFSLIYHNYEVYGTYWVIVFSGFWVIHNDKTKRLAYEAI